MPHWVVLFDHRAGLKPAQAFCGHRRAIMEGPTGFVVGAILRDYAWRVFPRHAVNDIASSLSVGIAISRDGDDIYRH